MNTAPTISVSLCPRLKIVINYYKCLWFERRNIFSLHQTDTVCTKLKKVKDCIHISLPTLALNATIHNNNNNNNYTPRHVLPLIWRQFSAIAVSGSRCCLAVEPRPSHSAGCRHRVWWSLQILWASAGSGMRVECVSGMWPQSIPLQNQGLRVWNWDKPGSIIVHILWKSEKKAFILPCFLILWDFSMVMRYFNGNLEA